MSSAMTQIVDAYVKLQDRPALAALQVHRRRLIDGLQSLRGPFDAANPIKQNQDELAIIEAGIARLGSSVLPATMSTGRDCTDLRRAQRDEMTSFVGVASSR